jgi:hypothetical protein
MAMEDGESYLKTNSVPRVMRSQSSTFSGEVGFGWGEDFSGWGKAGFVRHNRSSDLDETHDVRNSTRERRARVGADGGGHGSDLLGCGFVLIAEGPDAKIKGTF